MKDVIAEVQRQLPGTDKDRYDIAYERGKTQARSALATAGLALGVVVGTALMFFFDPVMGKRRRALLRDKAAAISNDISRTAEDTADDVGNRAKGFASEHDLPGSADGNNTEAIGE
jgi:gas vesicle protein